jgi:hypothetical protein
MNQVDGFLGAIFLHQLKFDPKVIINQASSGESFGHLLERACSR